MLELGHESLAVTQDYLADVRKPGEAKKAVSDADFIPEPKIWLEVGISILVAAPLVARLILPVATSQTIKLKSLHSSLAGLPAPSRCRVGGGRNAADHAGARAKTHARLRFARTSRYALIARLTLSDTGTPSFC